MIPTRELAARTRQAAGFSLGMRSFLRDRLGADDAIAAVASRLGMREERFLAVVDRLVWPYPDSPYRQLLGDAGLDHGGLRQLVRAEGLEPALVVLRDSGVYVGYEEYVSGRARRGSTFFDWRSTAFLNPMVRADYMGSTSGTASAGTPVGKSFAHLRTMAASDLVHRQMWGVDSAPTAVWFPVLPSSAGLNNVLRLAHTGNAPEAWFSHVAPNTASITGAKRVANRTVSPLARLFGTRLPRPEFADLADPALVLAWCRDALDRNETALLLAYPSSASLLSRVAVDAGVRLDGLVVRLGGEPVTPSKVESIEASGARSANCYAAAPFGRLASACPHCPPEELHVHEHDVALVARTREHPDGRPIEAFLWTSLVDDTPTVALNLENDDYGVVDVDAEACECSFGRLGIRRRVSGIRGMSKVVTGGITLPPDVFEQLVEVRLPADIGGGPTSFQFSEHRADDATRLILRVSPSIGPIDEDRVRASVSGALVSTDLGVLADRVWSGVPLQIVREDPVGTRSGKLLAFDMPR